MITCMVYTICRVSKFAYCSNNDFGVVVNLFVYTELLNLMIKIIELIQIYQWANYLYSSAF